MEVSPLQSTAKIDIAGMPLEQLANNSQVPEREKVDRACAAFEAVLLRQILAESQKPVFASKYVDNSTTSGIYRDLVVSQMAESISSSGTFGLAKSLSGEMQRQNLRPKAAANAASGAEPTPSDS